MYFENSSKVLTDHFYCCPSGFVHSFWKTQCMLLIEIRLLFLPSKCQTKRNGDQIEAECFCSRTEKFMAVCKNAEELGLLLRSKDKK